MFRQTMGGLIEAMTVMMETSKMRTIDVIAWEGWLEMQDGWLHDDIPSK